MSRLADIGLPETPARRPGAVWLVAPLLLLGAWELMAPRFHASGHGTGQGPAIPAAVRGVAPLD